MKRVETYGKIFGGLCCLILLILPESLNWISYGFFGIILLTVGIPHGAIDHLTSDPLINKSGLIRFVLLYLLLIFLYLVCWFFFPLTALVLFIVMSAYHFGQTHFLGVKAPRILDIILYLSRGSFFLALILFGNLKETAVILDDIVKIQLTESQSIGIISILFLSTVAIQVYLGIKIRKKDILELSLLGGLLYYSPLLVGFITYFGFWHALPSMIEEYAYLKRIPDYSTFRKFFIQLLPFTLISLVGIALILLIGQHYLETSQLILIFFIMISLISFPHIIYMDRFLRKST
jgi:Brp/Blh family beta-carotene 15,15'-monooxygenase